MDYYFCDWCFNLRFLLFSLIIYIIKLDGKKYSKSYNKARWNGRKVGRYSGIKD